MRRLGIAAVVLALLATYFLFATSAARTRTNTFDEIVHVTAGYNAWMLQDHRFDPGNGDFVKRWATLPLLFTRPNYPPLDTPAWRDAAYFDFSRDFFYRAGNSPDAILGQTRPMVAVLGVALCGLVFAWTRAAYGRTAALLALLLCVFCPNLLAHGATVSSDLALTLTLLGTTYFVWRLLHRLSWGNLAGSVGFFALLAVSKMTAVLILPITGILLVARALNPAPWHWAIGAARDVTNRARQFAMVMFLVIVHGIAAWATIWTVFEFKYVARGQPEDTALALPATPQGAKADGMLRQVMKFCRDTRALPEGYVDVLEQVLSISERRPSFMNGHWKAGGQTWFYPFAILVKTPPATFVLIALAIAALARMRRRSETETRPDDDQPALRRAAYESIPLIAVLVVSLGVAMNQAMNIGYRHILQVQPVLYMLAGAAALWLVPGRRSIQVLLGALIFWTVAESLAVRPSYFAYASSLLGGPGKGYLRLADSSLDWGQDLPSLKKWLESQPPEIRDNLYFSYFGTSQPEHYGIASRRLPGFPEWRPLRVFALEPGTYAISATNFQQLYVPTFGPWNRVYEEAYQKIVRDLGLTEENTRDSAALADALQLRPPEVWQALYGDYEKLRFGRLCAWLRGTARLPEAHAGYSILMWQLTAGDLKAALWAAPPELYEQPAGAVPEGVGARSP